jgi:[acyl-carrier-protein] S-malonyltransferase
VTRAEPRHDHHVPASVITSESAQREALVIGWIDGWPIDRRLLDQRLNRLLEQAAPGQLPTAGTAEFRQFVRWAAHVLFTEVLCSNEVGPAAGADRRLAPIEALQLGSINAAAWHNCAAVSAAFESVVPAVAAPSSAEASARWLRVSHALAPDPEAVARCRLVSIGWTTTADLPADLASALLGADPGVVVGPIRSALGWHVARVEEIAGRPVTTGRPSAGDRGPRLREFARWLDRRRRDALSVAPGFEHPGDPHQPDNTHRH